MKKSNEIDFKDPDANMYGCMPCPRCKSRYRYVDQYGDIICDDCDFREQVSQIKSEGKEDK